jgi:hypothetical protein
MNKSQLIDVLEFIDFCEHHDLAFLNELKTSSLNQWATYSTDGTQLLSFADVACSNNVDLDSLRKSLVLRHKIDLWKDCGISGK